MTYKRVPAKPPFCMTTIKTLKGGTGRHQDLSTTDCEGGTRWYG